MTINELKNYIKEVISELDLLNHDDLIRYRCLQDVLTHLEKGKNND